MKNKLGILVVALFITLVAIISVLSKEPREVQGAVNLADTAVYIHKYIKSKLPKGLNLHIALVTGGAGNQTIS